jgi:Phage tail tube protein
MAKNWEQKVILLKLETTEGTDAAPTNLLNALRVLNYQPTFMDADQKVRNIEKAYFGADPVAMAAFKRGATFDMEMAGSGTAIGIPPWMVPLQIAGFGAPVVGSTSVVSSPITAGIPSATHWSYIDNLLLKTIGARATVDFKIQDDEYPLFSFNLLGRPPALLAEEAIPGTPTFTNYVDPLLSATENTTFTLAGFALPLRSWEMSSNSDLQLRSLIGPQDRVNYANRNWNGNIVGELPDLTSQNYFSNIRPGTTMAATCVQGITTGNIVQIDTPRLQISGNVTLTEEQGKVMFTMPVTALPNAGNDEVVFTSK